MLFMKTLQLLLPKHSMLFSNLCLLPFYKTQETKLE